MIRLDVKVPKYSFELANELVVMEAAGAAVKREMVSRLEQGLGARGALPTPKDGGRPMVRTGRLLQSIDVVFRWRNMRGGRWTAVVRATGDRPAEEVGGKAAAARAAQRERRATLAVALTLASLSEAGAASVAHLRRKKATKDGQVFKLSSVRVRAGTTNASVAAILSQPPVDKRAANGGRAQYRVFEPNELYNRIVRRTIETVGIFRLLDGEGRFEPGMADSAGAVVE